MRGCDALKPQKRKESPTGCFGGRNKRQKVSPEDRAEMEIAKEVVPPGCKLGRDQSRARWYARDDSIQFSLERSAKRWEDAGSLCSCVQAAWDACDVENPHVWAKTSVQEILES